MNWTDLAIMVIGMPLALVSWSIQGFGVAVVFLVIWLVVSAVVALAARRSRAAQVLVIDFFAAITTAIWIAVLV
jgi:hypothetical protein